MKNTEEEKKIYTVAIIIIGIRLHRIRGLSDVCETYIYALRNRSLTDD